MDCGKTICESEDANENQISNCIACLEIGGGLDCRNNLSLTDQNAVQAINLPSLGADPSSVVFAGFSSGSFMSHQLHITFSETIKGVGLMAGGPYYSKSFGVLTLPKNWA